MKVVRPIAIVDADLTSNVAESEAVWNAGTTYAKDAIARGNTTETAHQLYVSLQATNLNKPLTDPLWWKKFTLSNRWKMFDTVVNTQTANPEMIEIIYQTHTRVNSVTLLNISASALRIIMTDPVEGVVYDVTHPLVSTAGIDNWYSWFFSDIRRLRDISVTLPAFSNTEITIQLLDPGDTVRCGTCVIGRVIEIGASQYGSRIGGRDYSVKDNDDFGNAILVRRSFARRGDFTVHLSSGQIDSTFELFEELRAIPIVWIGSDEYGSTLIYGWWREFEFEFTWQKKSIYTIGIEGLV